MSQWLPIHPTIIDPSTGEPLRALTVIGNMPVWPMMGSQDENEGGSEEGENPSQGEEVEAEEGDDPKEDKPGEGTVSLEEYERIKARMQAADRRASAAESKVKEHERAGQSDLDRVSGERDDAVKRAESAEQALNSERIANSFLANNSVTWHDPEDALAMLRTRYMDGVEISEDGKISGMKKAIEKMAKEKSYLVNSGSGESSSGDAMNGKRKGDTNKETQSARDKELAKRMPALGRGNLMT